MITESDLTQPSADESRRGRLLDLGRLPAKLIQQASRDPADSVSGAPANFGQSVLPHIYTIQAQYGTQGRAYLQADEALKHNRHNANIMRTETQIMECLEARQRGVALLNWHIEPEDDKSHDQRELVKELTRIVERTPDFLEYRRNLLEALWYGRYACANSFRSVQVGNHWRQVVGRWEPRHGDKLVFRYETDTKEYNPDQVGIRIHAGFYRDPLNHQKVEQTHFGLVRWFDEWERKLFSLHKHIIEDGPFEEPYDAGRIHGVGIRDRIYWTWYAMKELEANLLIYMERTALGVEIWRYPKGNSQAEEATRIAATERVANGRTIVLVPIEPGANADLYGVERIEPGGAGAEVMLELIRDFYGHRIKRYILGQVLSSEAAATGLGSGVADAHMATYADIIQYDATKLEESLTRDFLHVIRDRNFRHARGINVRFKIDTQADNVQEKLEALKLAWDMGLEMKTDDVFDSIGLSRPDKSDETVKNPQFDQAAMMGGMGGGMPGQGGGTSTFGPMPGNPLAGTPKDADSDGVAGEGTGQAKPATNDLDRYGRRYDPATVHERASQAKEDPSDPQREAGNYVKGHVSIHGLRLSIENPKGTRRRPEWPILPAHYGYIRGYEGRDKDHIDVFLGPDPNAEIVFIVDQVTEGGRFDEHKVLMGFHTQKEAVDTYRSAYQSGWRVGPVTSLTIDQFKRWLDKGDLTKRAEGQVSKYGANHIPGGIGDKTNPSDVDPDELAAGIEVELEHTDDPAIAREIALDHLTEDPHYYAKLRTIESPQRYAESQGGLFGGDEFKQTRKKKTKGEEFDSKTGKQSTMWEGMHWDNPDQQELFGDDKTTDTGKLGKPEFTKTPKEKQAESKLSGKSADKPASKPAESKSERSEGTHPSKSGKWRWITIGGGEGGGGSHEGGTPVLIDEDGNIGGGPGALTGKNLKDLDKDKTGTSADKRKDNDPPGAGSESVSKPAEPVRDDATELDTPSTDTDSGPGNPIPTDKDTPGNVELRGMAFDVYQDSGTWFFRKSGRTELGCTAASSQTANWLNGQFDASAKAEDPEPKADSVPDEPESEPETTNPETDNTKPVVEPESESESDEKPFSLANMAISLHEKLHERGLADKPTEKTRSKMMEDFGEKIGGARKDIAVATGPRGKSAKEKDPRPAWARRYEISQIASSMNRSEEGKWSIRDNKSLDWMKQPKQATKTLFDTKEEAEKAIPLIAASRNHGVYNNARSGEPANWAIARQIGDRKRPVVKDGFATREEAMKYLATHPEEIIEHKFPRYETYQYLDRVERIGGNKTRSGDVSTKDFQDAFGFRGGEFGNWQSGTDGQTSLNHAYDALHDLTDMLGMPTEFASLDGDLAIGFGSRGTGGLNAARAHYEPAARVINLTKMKGAGSLAHEWLHALDHHLAKKTGSSASSTNSLGYKHKLPEELGKAVKGIQDAMFSSESTEAYSTQSETKATESAKSHIQDYMKDLERGFEPSSYRKVKPLSKEDRAKWDKLKSDIENGDFGKKVFVPGKSRFGGYQSYEKLAEMNNLYKKSTGRSFHTSDDKSKGNYIFWSMYRYGIAKEALKKANEGETKTVKRHSQYAMDAADLDHTRTGAYYTLPEEMMARAFEAYTMDKLAEKGQRNDYLGAKADNRYYAAFGLKPFPEGEERKRINAAFDQLFDEIRKDHQ